MASFSRTLEEAIHRALALANTGRHEFGTIEHLLLALLDEFDTAKVMEACNVDIEKLRTTLTAFMETEYSTVTDKEDSTEAIPTTGFQRVILRAITHVQSTGRTEVTGANILVAIFSERDSHAVYFLHQQGMVRFDAVNFIAHGVTKIPDASNNTQSGDTPSGSEEDENDPAYQKDSKGENRSVIQKYCVNLNEQAEMGNFDPLIGRQNEIERCIQIFCRRRKNNPLLVGESGVGKTAIAEGLAKKIVENSVPNVLENATVYALDMGALVAGTRYRGDFEERMKSVIRELGTQKHAILFIDEIHTIIGAGATSGGAMDAANLLKPALQSGSLCCMGATTFKEYRQHFEKDRALLRRFQKVEIKEPSCEEAVKILKGLKSYFEEHHSIRYTADAIRQAVELSNRYICDRYLPDKAIDVIDESGAAQRLLPFSKRKKVITVKEIEDVVAKISGRPSHSVTHGDSEVLFNLEDKLKRVIFGQDKALNALASTIKIARAGLREPTKPTACYLFCGPTGVGKTEAARQLSDALGIPLKRFDMSEYMERHSISRLIGTPPGYVGYEQGGLMTDAVEQNPHCVLLLDEIEKAHQDIYNILLQVMDHGKLTDSTGRSVDFRNVILIITSNAGAEAHSKASLGFNRDKKFENELEAVEKVFSPEFRNRLDAIISFSPLSHDIVLRVVEKMVLHLEAQLIERNVRIELSSEASRWIADKGYDPTMGARPIARIIHEHLKKPLATELLFGKLTKGGVVGVTVKDDELNLSCKSYEKTKSNVKPQVSKNIEKISQGC